MRTVLLNFRSISADNIGEPIETEKMKISCAVKWLLYLTIVLTFYLPASQAQAQFRAGDLEILYELELVRVVVNAPQAARIGLDAGVMAQAITARLEESRIEVAGREFGPRLNEIPALTVSIYTVSVATLLAGAYAYIIDLELREPTELYRNSSVAMEATTWRAYSRQGTITDRHPDQLIFDVDRMIDDFVNAYITANADIIRRR